MLTYFWFITLGLIGLCIYFRYVQQSVPQTTSIRWLQFTPFLLTLSIIVCGGVLQADNSAGKFYPWATNVIYALLLLHFPISGMAIWQAKVRRRFIVALSAFQLWLSLNSGFVSLMSVQNAWL